VSRASRGSVNEPSAERAAAASSGSAVAVARLSAPVPDSPVSLAGTSTFMYISRILFILLILTMINNSDSFTVSLVINIPIEAKFGPVSKTEVNILVYLFSKIEMSRIIK